MLDITFDVVVAHMKFELKALLYIDDARVRTALSVDLAVEQLGSLNFRNHVTGSAVDGYVVAGR